MSSKRIKTLESVYAPKVKSSKKPLRISSARPKSGGSKKKNAKKGRPVSARPRLQSETQKSKPKVSSPKLSKKIPPPQTIEMENDMKQNMKPKESISQIEVEEKDSEGFTLVNLRVKKLALIKLLYGEVNSHVARGLIDLARGYIEVEEYEMSIVHSKKSLKMSQFIEEDSNTSKLIPEALSTLSMAFYKLNQLNRAKHLLKEALKHTHNVKGEESELNFPILLGLAKVCANKKQFEEGLSFLEKAWSLQKQKDETHPKMIAVFLEWGKILVEQDETKGAIEMYEMASKLLSEHQSRDSPDLGYVCYILVDLYTVQGEYERGLELARYAYNVLCKSDLGQKTTGATLQLHVQITLGFVLVKCSQYEKASEILENALEQESEITATEHASPPLTAIQKANTLKMLGTVYLALEYGAQAIQAYRQAVKTYAKEFGMQDERTQQLIQRIAELEDDYSQEEQNDEEINDTTGRDS